MEILRVESSVVGLTSIEGGQYGRNLSLLLSPSIYYAQGKGMWGPCRRWLIARLTVLRRTDLTGPWSWTFHVKPWENKILLLKSSSQWYFGMADLADKYRDFWAVGRTATMGMILLWKHQIFPQTSRTQKLQKKAWTQGYHLKGKENVVYLEPP